MKSVAALYLISALHPLLLLLRSDKQPQAHQPYLLLVGASTARWTEAYNWFHCFFCTPWLWWPAAAPAINGTTMDQEVKEPFLFHNLTFIMKTRQFNNLKVEYFKQLKKVGKVHKYIFRHRQKWLVKKGAMENVWWKKPIPHRHQEWFQFASKGDETLHFPWIRFHLREN